MFFFLSLFLFLQEKHIIFALVILVLTIVVPSMILAAPTFLEKLMDVNNPDQDDQAFAAAVQNLDKRDVGRMDDDQGFALSQEIRERRSSRMVNRCMTTCWVCIKAFHKDAIQLGECFAGCSGKPTTKMLNNPLEAQSWSTCQRNFLSGHWWFKKDSFHETNLDGTLIYGSYINYCHPIIYLYFPSDP